MRGLGELGVQTGTGKTVAINEALLVSGEDGFLGAAVQPVQAGAKQGIQAEVYIFGQPPLDINPALEHAKQVMLEMGVMDAKVSASQAYPLAWSWAYDAKDKSWVAYVSNTEAGPFARLLDMKRAYFVQYTTPVAADVKDLPTQGYVVQAVGEKPRAMPPEERLRLINRFKPSRPLGADLFFALRFYSIPPAKGWLVGLLALGGLAYWRSKA